MHFSTWQDWSIFIGQVILAITLWPTVRQRIKLPLFTSVPAVAIMVLFAITFASLSLWAAMASSLFALAMWIGVLSNGIAK